MSSPYFDVSSFFLSNSTLGCVRYVEVWGRCFSRAHMGGYVGPFLFLTYSVGLIRPFPFTLLLRKILYYVFCLLLTLRGLRTYIFSTCSLDIATLVIMR